MLAAMTGGPVEGLRLFVVEDEALVAMMLEDMLADLGCEIVDIASTVRDALNRLPAASATADGAVLDVNIGGEMVFPVADALTELGLPFMFVTGYGRNGLGGRYPGAQVLAKPYSARSLTHALSQFPHRAC
jgi:CheY-like chemotaxis protein